MTDTIYPGNDISLAIWDLAGQPEFKSVHNLFYKGSVGFIVVFSLVDRNSFDEVLEWIKNFIKNSSEVIPPLLIIANKLDLHSDQNSIVQIDEIDQLSSDVRNRFPQIPQVYQITTSAKTGKNVETGISEFAQNILQWYFNREKSQKIPNSVEGVALNVNFPNAYLFVMNQIVGPTLICKSPEINHFTIDNSEDMVKLIASLDFEDLVRQTSMTNYFKWDNDNQFLYYIAFVEENYEARGNNSLYVVAVACNKDNEVLIQKQSPVIDGYLHQTMNQILKIKGENDSDFITERFDRNKHLFVIDSISKILENLKSRINEVTFGNKTLD